MNDYWIIDGIELYPNNKVQIFDRYNNLIYEMSGYNNKDIIWYGQTNKGLFVKEVPEGTYFYTLNLGDGGSLLSGFIILKKE